MDLLSAKYRRAEKHWQHAVDELPVFLWGDVVRGHRLPGFVWTKNEHHAIGDSPRQRFPDRDYLRTLEQLYEQEPLLLIWKSRQLMVTWAFCSFYIWEALHPGRNILHLCKTEEGSIKNLKRMRFIFDNLPRFWVPKIYPPQDTPKMIQMTFSHPEADSIIHGANQNSEYARQETVSHAWVDEGDFTDSPDEMMAGLAPTIQGGGRFAMSTTPNAMTYFLEQALDNKRLRVKDINTPFGIPDLGELYGTDSPRE